MDAKNRKKYLRETVDNLDIAKELASNRYLLNVILSNLYRIQHTMNTNIAILKQEQRKTETEKVQPKEKDKKKKELRILNRINFERFSIKAEQHDALIREYGIDVVNEACMLLDGWLKTHPTKLKDNYKKLKQWAIHQVVKKRLSDISSDIVKASTTIDYKSIEDVIQAKKYIASVPSHIRNVDYGVKYLIEKFNIGGEVV